MRLERVDRVRRMRSTRAACEAGRRQVGAAVNERPQRPKPLVDGRVHLIAPLRGAASSIVFVFFVSFVVARSASVVHIRNTPNFAGGIGALNAAEIPSASASRVFAGSRMPSSQSRAVE
jgi:hypothetical protein